MKNKHILIIITISTLLFGCETKNVETRDTNFVINGSELEIYIIDSCEYIGRVHMDASDKLTHKGNCKFCLKRNNTK